MPDSNELKHIKIALLLSGLMLCLAVVPVWPYGFYLLLRLVVCASCGYAAYFLRQDPVLSVHFIPLVFLAVLFNPILPVHLGSLLWLLIDLGTAVYFLSIAKKIQ
jgi:hypothetical protein